ncbi:MAG: hypothetical protein AAFV78_18325 [Bacteroidota bacterium]
MKDIIYAMTIGFLALWIFFLQECRRSEACEKQWVVQTIEEGFACYDTVWEKEVIRIPEPAPLREYVALTPVSAASPKAKELQSMTAIHPVDTIREYADTFRVGGVVVYGWHRTRGHLLESLYTGGSLLARPPLIMQEVRKSSLWLSGGLDLGEQRAGIPIRLEYSPGKAALGYYFAYDPLNKTYGAGVRLRLLSWGRFQGR